MSLFRAAIQSPLTARDMTIYIPDLKLATVVEQSSTLPTEEFKSYKISLHGSEIELPTYAQVSGDWTVVLADGTHTIVRQQLLSLLYSKTLFNVYLIPGVKLNLNTGNGINTLVTLAQESLSLLHSGVILGGCWIRSIQPAQFSESQPETPVTWTVSIHYNYVSPLISKLIGE